jgi:hypothetical protein
MLPSSSGKKSKTRGKGDLSINWPTSFPSSSYLTTVSAGVTQVHMCSAWLPYHGTLRFCLLKTLCSEILLTIFSHLFSSQIFLALLTATSPVRSLRSPNSCPHVLISGSLVRHKRWCPCTKLQYVISHIFTPS